jgi:outer membrane biogenesis lipoprotein LolB
MRLLILAIVMLTGCASNQQNQVAAPTKVVATDSYTNMAAIGAVTAQNTLVLNVTKTCSRLSPGLEKQSHDSLFNWEQRNKEYRVAFGNFLGEVAINIDRSKGGAAADEFFIAVESQSKATAEKFINSAIFSDPEPIKACGVVLAMINDGVSDIKNIKKYKNEIESIHYHYH